MEYAQRDKDLKAAKKMHERAQGSYKPYDYILAAELFEKVGWYETAASCRAVAENLMRFSPSELNDKAQS